MSLYCGTSMVSIKTSRQSCFLHALFSVQNTPSQLYQFSSHTKRHHRPPPSSNARPPAWREPTCTMMVKGAGSNSSRHLPRPPPPPRPQRLPRPLGWRQRSAWPPPPPRQTRPLPLAQPVLPAPAAGARPPPSPLLPARALPRARWTGARAARAAGAPPRSVPRVLAEQRSDAPPRVLARRGRRSAGGAGA